MWITIVLAIGIAGATLWAVAVIGPLMERKQREGK